MVSYNLTASLLLALRGQSAVRLKLIEPAGMSCSESEEVKVKELWVFGLQLQ